MDNLMKRTKTLRREVVDHVEKKIETRVAPKLVKKVRQVRKEVPGEIRATAA